MVWLPRFALATLVVCGLALHSELRAGDPVKTGFLNKIFKSADGAESKYVLFVPHDYKGDKEYPIILFLHGSGSKGDDGAKQAKGGLATAIRKKEKAFGFIT